MPESPDLPHPTHASVPRVPLPVTITRGEVPLTNEVAFWGIIRNSSDRISFNAYEHYINKFCGVTNEEITELRRRYNLPFTRVDTYELLKAQTEHFLKTRVGVIGTVDWDKVAATASVELGRQISKAQIEDAWNHYVGGNDTIPYLDLLRGKFNDFRTSHTDASQLCTFILTERLTQPTLLELIWSYWHEEALLVQVLNAVSLRFQNRRGPGDKPFLAQLEIDPLRPLNNLLWGYVQDEQHRLSIARRDSEYRHEYGLCLLGKAVGEQQPADTRSNFLEGFHRLLHITPRFYQQDDDTTVRADAFPVLNALKEVNVSLGEGGSNQFGDLPWVARSEMLMQQWILARPEMREFFSSRPSVIYPERWMERLESAKTLLGLSGPSVLHMFNLATMGERILLSIRYHPWTGISDTPEAANWARSFRSDIQGYIHGYHAVTGVDLSASAVADRIDARLPSLLMRERRESMGRR